MLGFDSLHYGLSWWSGGPSQWWVSLTIRCLEALLLLFLPVQGSLVYRLDTAEPVQGSPFHLWTCSCASVAGGPVLVWACPLMPDGVPERPSVLLWKPVEASAGCWLGCPCGTPAKC